MILTYDQIKQANADGDITIEPFEESQIQAASYDLRIGDQGATTSSHGVVDIKKKGFLVLKPGDFGVIICLEKIRLGAQYAARFGLRSKFARKGLIATTGPQIDPGYEGRLILGITNLTPNPVSLSYGDDIVTVEFHKLAEPTSHPYVGPYQGRERLGPDEIDFITETEGMALSEVLTTLRTLTADVSSLNTSVGSVASQVKMFTWIVSLVVTIGIAVIGLLLAIGPHFAK